jgi:hypothetical protein
MYLHTSPLQKTSSGANRCSLFCHIFGLTGRVMPRLSRSVLCFAALISDRAAGLARGLAGSLALAAAAVLGAVAQVTGLDGLNAVHNALPP